MTESALDDAATNPADWFTRNRLKLRHLNVLLEVVRARNIGRAAQALHTSQPAVSKALQEVERAAGVPLFERRADGTFATAAGETLVIYAREVFGALSRAGVELESLTSGLSGTLTIGCNLSSAAHLVPHALLRLKKLHPRLRVKVREGSIENMIPDLRARQLDVIVARWPRGRQLRELEEHALFEQPMCVVAAGDHPLAGVKRVTWRSLAGWPWILPPEGSAARDDLEEIFRLERIVPNESGIECASVFVNSVLLKQMRALTVYPVTVARHLITERLFSVLAVKVPPAFGPNSAITLREREHPPALGAFLRCLNEAAKIR